MTKLLRKISVLLTLTLCINLVDTVTLQPYIVKANEPNTEISFSRGGNVSISNIDSQNSFKLLMTGDNLANTEFVHQNWVYKVKKFDYTYYTSESYTYYENEPYTYTERGECLREGRNCAASSSRCTYLCRDSNGGTYTNSHGCSNEISHSCESVCHRYGSPYCVQYKTIEKTGYRSVAKTGTRSVANHHTLLPANITVNQATNTFSLPSSGTVTMERVRKHEIPVKLKFDVEGIRELTVNGKKIDI